ncbi:hypothetical protein B0H19DRAFT_1062110 [Mycena capillaripes]|nr:hypothetical protein B0H19DRAFT_1062110 [Mycena capillaripes]
MPSANRQIAGGIVESWRSSDRNREPFIYQRAKTAVGIIQQRDLHAYSNLDTASAAIETASTYLAAILPAVTIIIVRSKNSFERWTVTSNTAGTRPSPGPGKISTLRFEVHEATNSAGDSDSTNSSGSATDARRTDSHIVDQ